MIEPPEHGFPWVRVPLDTTLPLIICGEPASYRVHWVRVKEGARPTPVRCVIQDGHGCRLCDQAVGHRVRYVIPVIHEDRTKLLEVGSIQYPWLQMTQVSIDLAARDGRPDGRWEGRQILVGRDRPLRNAEIWIRSTGWTRLSPEQHVDIGPLVSTLGREALNAWRRQAGART